MKTVKISQDSIRPHDMTYAHDRNFNFAANKKIQTSQGLCLSINNITKNATDTKINNSTCLALTDKLYTRNAFNIQYDDSDLIYPYSFVTYFIFSREQGLFYSYDTSTDIRTYPGDDPEAVFLNIEELASDEITTRQTTISSGESFDPIVPTPVCPTTRLFQVDLLDKTYCRVTHNDGFVKTSLTYSDTASTSASCVFEQYDESQTEPSDPQIFEYNLVSNQGYMALSKQLADGSRVFIIHQFPEGAQFGEGGQLAGGGPVLDTDEGWPTKSMICVRIDSLVFAAAGLSRVDTSWVKYKTKITTQNSMQIDDTIDTLFNHELDTEIPTQYYYMNSYSYLANNYLISNLYHTITGNEMSINFTPLKNQLTPESRQDENSPHSVAETGDNCFNFVSRTNIEYRTYHKINSGTNQDTGDDRLYLSYTAYTDTVTLPADNITYFHMPNRMSPYQWLSINYRRVPDYPSHFTPSYQKLPVAVPGSRGFPFEDFVGLIRAGAIAGDDPMTSDKIFKKRADYRYFSNWGDATRAGNKGATADGVNLGDNVYGTWLCAWLQAPFEDEFEHSHGPVWMDRYFDDKKFTDISEVLSQPVNCAESTIKRHELYGERGYFDAPSSMTLDRGVLYAYHHIGDSYNKAILDTHTKNLVQHGLDGYTQYTSAGYTPGVADQQDDTTVYNFIGDTYGRSKAPEPPYGDFRLSFWMYSDDWTNNFGHQVMGNYTTEGFAVINDDVITPVLTFIDDDHIKLTNTDGETLMTITGDQYTDSVSTIQDSTVTISRDSTLGDIMIAASTEKHLFINVVNFNGSVTNTLTVSSDLMKTQPVNQMSRYRPGFDDLEFKQSGKDYPEEVLYIMYDSVSSVGQINMVTGEYRDTDTNNFWFSAELSGFEITTDDGIPLYDGTYIMDSTIGLQNEAPVYRKIETITGVLTPHMYYADGAWHITTNLEFPSDERIASSQGEPPESGEWLWDMNDGSASGKMLLEYGSSLKRPVYIKTSDTPDYRSLHVTSDTGDLFVVDGDHVTMSNTSSNNGSNRLFYTGPEGVYVYNVKSSVSTFVDDGARIIKTTGHTINNMKIDEQENIWLLYDNNVVSKYDKQYSHVFSVSLSGHVDQATRSLSGDMCFDLIKEYPGDGQSSTYAAIFHVDDNMSTTDLIKVYPDGSITFDTSRENVLSSQSQITKNTNFSNYDTIRRKNYRASNTLTFKFKAKNKFDNNDYVEVIRDIPVSNLSPGWHHFCFGYDARIKSIAYYYVDGMLYNQTGLSNRLNRGKHAFTDIMSKTATVGATQGYNNVLLSEFLKQPGYYYAHNTSIKSYRLYNFNMYRGDIKVLSREHIKIPDIEWTIPCGRRAHLDHVTTFHTHQIPGYKTGDFDVSILNTGLSGDAQRDVMNEVHDAINNFKLTTTNQVNVHWKETIKPEV